jgi:hypothetical protein
MGEVLNDSSTDLLSLPGIIWCRNDFRISADPVVTNNRMRTTWTECARLLAFQNQTGSLVRH